MRRAILTVSRRRTHFIFSENYPNSHARLRLTVKRELPELKTHFDQNLIAAPREPHMSPRRKNSRKRLLTQKSSTSPVSKLRCEPLEDRRMLATFTAMNNSDAGAGSLRQAITDANSTAGADTIEFASSVTGQIDIASQLPAITEDLSIVGPGANVLTLAANGTGFRFFEINDGNAGANSNVSISGLTMTGADVSVFAGGEIERSGGAIINHETLTIADSAIDSNTAFLGGAIMNRPGGILSVSGSTLSDNRALFAGGAIHQQTTTTNVVNSTISGNSADILGGAIYQLAGAGTTDTLTIEHSTFQGNQSGVNTSIHSYGPGTKVMTLKNSIIEGLIDNGTVTGDNNILGSSDPGITGSNNLFNTDAMLSPLADNAGPTPTHRPQTGSPAINAGDPAAAAGVGTTPIRDQRGFSRVQGGRMDIGAIESNALPAQGLVVSTNSDVFDFDFTPGQLSLREAVFLANDVAGADTITFDNSLGGDTITLSGPELVPSESVTVDATSLSGNLTIDANGSSRIFNNTTAGQSLTLKGLTLLNGFAGVSVNAMGGAVYSTEELFIYDSILDGNRADLGGAVGIFGLFSNNARLTIRDSTITGSTDGGGISLYTAPPSLWSTAR